MNLILLGAPGAGKGTQAEVISEHLHIPTISTGNIIREALKSGSEMGEKARSYMDKGALVPDEIVIGIIKERLAEEDCRNGFLRGFLRSATNFTHTKLYRRKNQKESPSPLDFAQDVSYNVCAHKY